jgi:hypothetical protein
MKAVYTFAIFTILFAALASTTSAAETNQAAEHHVEEVSVSFFSNFYVITV